MLNLVRIHADGVIFWPNSPGFSLDRVTWFAKRCEVESAGLIDCARIAFDAGRYEEARDLLLELLREKPGDSAAFRSLGTVSTRLGQPAQAFRYCQQAVQADPKDADAHFTLALLYLLHGNFEKGFIEYEWRLSRRNCIAPRYAQGAVWDGRLLRDEALMLHCEQGFGDAMQFIRFLPQVRERVGKIHLACHPELVRLFSGLPGLAGIVTDGQPLPKCKYHVPLLSLPRLFKTTLATLPRDVPYLPASLPRSVGRDRPRVGFVWCANRASPNSAQRSVPLEQMRALADLPCEWISLQRDPTPEEQEILRRDFGAEDCGSAFLDFQDTAECLQTLDLVLTVDTSMAHLAGALNIPTWLLLPRWADWRWMLDRADSPWYPALTLYRQATDGDWSGPMQAVGQGLSRLIER